MTLNEWVNNRSLNEDAGAGAVSGGPSSASVGSGVTNSSNIAFIPSQFGKTIAPKLRQLSKRGKKLPVKVTSIVGGKNYKIAECLSINVPYQYLECFRKDFFQGNPIWESEFDIDLSAYLNEAFENEMVLAGESFKTVVTGLLNSDVFKSFRHKMAGFVKDSGDTHLNFTPIGNSLLTEPGLETQVAQFITVVEKSYRKDLGGLQLLTRAISERTPLNSFPLFSKIDNLVGTQVNGEFLGIPFIYNAEITADFTSKEKLKIGNPDLENRLKTNPELKWENGIFYPTEPTGFPYNLTELLVKYIKGADNGSN